MHNNAANDRISYDFAGFAGEKNKIIKSIGPGYNTDKHRTDDDGEQASHRNAEQKANDRAGKRAGEWKRQPDKQRQRPRSPERHFGLLRLRSLFGAVQEFADKFDFSHIIIKRYKQGQQRAKPGEVDEKNNDTNADSAESQFQPG